MESFSLFLQSNLRLVCTYQKKKMTFLLSQREKNLASTMNRHSISTYSIASHEPITKTLVAHPLEREGGSERLFIREEMSRRLKLRALWLKEGDKSKIGIVNRALNCHLNYVK
jgi:hypothetical protein